jgi:hypothetical protein
MAADSLRSQTKLIDTTAKRLTQTELPIEMIGAIA